MITKQNKKEIINKLKDVFGQSGSVAFVNFKGLTVADSSNIRRSLRSEGVKYLVARKTLVNKALEDQSVSGVRPDMPGELALVYGADSLAPARSIYDFQKKLDGKLSIVGGIFDGEYKSKESMLQIASIPSLSVLHGMFVNIINSPIQRFAVALGAIANSKN